MAHKVYGTLNTNLNADLLDGQHGSHYQARVSGSCDIGSTIRAINADGTVTCLSDGPLKRGAAPAANTAMAVDTGGTSANTPSSPSGQTACPWSATTTSPMAT